MLFDAYDACLADVAKNVRRISRCVVSTDFRRHPVAHLT